VLAAAGMAPRLRREGVVSLLSFGYCIGRTTLFEDVFCLEPASTLTIDIDSLQHRTERYWNLRFRGTRELRNRSHAERALYDTLRASQSLVLCDDPPSYEVLLSGGLDSRGVMAFADALGKLPSTAFTWGATHAIPNSDAFVARRVADAYHVPHRFFAYDTADFVAHARDWAYVSELATDNVGWCAEGQPTLARVYRSGAAFTIAGDVAWDSGGYAFSEREMHRHVLSADIPGTLAACAGEHADECRRIFNHEINQVLSSCENDDLTDRKDYLYLNARVARFIMSLGYYKEHAIEVRRPFLSRAALELFASLPQTHRVEKNIYVSMLHNRFARLMEIPEQSVDSLPNWEHDVRAPGALREFFLRYLDRGRIEGGVLGAIFDGDAFVARRDAYFAAPVAAAAPAAHASWKASFPLRDRVLPFVQRHRAVDRLSRLVRQGSAMPRRTDFDVLRSVALVTMLEESLDRFAPSPMR
jgi:asparagine synthetase B (glutamine-hydrolysing)